ncbi:MAG: 7-cyano-7-deazaguanine synthase QueC [Rickettsiaceae bacterium]|nr:7-cyano-7-deazaguanine synthase QueC [Rickettsiaceae bacterium]
MKKSVILVSGGLDSSTVLAMLNDLKHEIYAISFYYGQRHNIEIAKIKQLIYEYDVFEHKIVNIDLSLFGGSALTDKDISVPKYATSTSLGDEIPVTYVPGRNTIFLSYALSYAEVIGAKDIFVGAHVQDSANYPDCRLEYFKTFEKLANLATKMGVETGGIKIHNPLLAMTKAEIVKLGLEYGVDYSKTISCYDPTKNGESCGKCHACLVRLEAFATNNIKDPISYVNKITMETE